MTTKTCARILAQIALPTGALTEALAVIYEHIPAAISGIAVIIVGVAAVVIEVIDQAVRDTSQERRRLHEAQDASTAEYARYLGARSWLDCETERVLRVAESADRRRKAEYEHEREELLADVEDKRAQIRNEGYQLCLDHLERGILNFPTQQGGAQIITMPRRAVGSDPTASGQGVNTPS